MPVGDLMMVPPGAAAGTRRTASRSGTILSAESSSEGNSHTARGKTDSWVWHPRFTTGDLLAYWGGVPNTPGTVERHTCE